MRSDCGKHQSLVKILANELRKKDYVNTVNENEEYKKGEFDVLTRQGKHFVYYEVKSNNTYKLRQKARKQIKRGTLYMNKLTGLDCYGVYVSPSRIKILGKNGELR